MTGHANATDPLVEAIAKRVVELLAPILGASRPAIYTSHKRGPHLPGKTQRWCVRNMRNIPGARQIGRDWQVSAEDYEAWARAVAKQPPAPKGSGARLMAGEDELAARFLRDAGIRVARKTG